MSALAEFLLARIAEDEAVAKAAAERGGAKWSAFHTLPNDYDDDKTHEGIWFAGDEYVLWETEGSSFMGGAYVHMAHIAAWNPARVLADCAAKRRLIDRYLNTTFDNWAEPDHEYERWVLPSLALPYAEHPDYREEWAT